MTQFIEMKDIDTTQVPEGTVIVCQWFRNCENEVVGALTHPVLGAVLTCQHHVDWKMSK
jgi:hypothetical protein